MGLFLDYRYCLLCPEPLACYGIRIPFRSRRQDADIKEYQRPSELIGLDWIPSTLLASYFTEFPFMADTIFNGNVICRHCYQKAYYIFYGKMTEESVI